MERRVCGTDSGRLGASPLSKISGVDWHNSLEDLFIQGHVEPWAIRRLNISVQRLRLTQPHFVTLGLDVVRVVFRQVGAIAGRYQVEAPDFAAAVWGYRDSRLFCDLNDAQAGRDATAPCHVWLPEAQGVGSGNVRKAKGRELVFPSCK